MADKYHLTARGEPARCRASQRECPLGSVETHFSTPAEARSYYEKAMKHHLFSTPSPKTMKIYRVGDLTPPETYFDDLDQFLTKVDSYAPAGRQHRRGAIFASPDFRSHGRWAGNNPKEHHELTVDPDAVYVYRVDLYELASAQEGMGQQEKFLETVKEFWDSGMTLRQWQQLNSVNKPERGTWELIVSPEAIKGARKMSLKRVLANVEEKDRFRIGKRI